MRDLDGSLTGTSNAVVVSDSTIAQGDSRCSANSNNVFGAVCVNTTDWLRFAFNDANPYDPLFINITNEANYMDISPKLHKRLTHVWGFMAALEANQVYMIEFQYAEMPTNISYDAGMYGLKTGQWIVIKHRLNTQPDRVVFTSYAGTGVPSAEESNYPLNSSSPLGSWYWENSTFTLSYILN